ncbi:MAG: hypothetical protein R3F34_03555 [Planctomycetota bacterium]
MPPTITNTRSHGSTSSARASVETATRRSSVSCDAPWCTRPGPPGTRLGAPSVLVRPVPRPATSAERASRRTSPASISSTSLSNSTVTRPLAAASRMRRSFEGSSLKKSERL